jgi:hypothetical protein
VQKPNPNKQRSKTQQFVVVVFVVVFISTQFIYFWSNNMAGLDLANVFNTTQSNPNSGFDLAKLASALTANNTGSTGTSSLSTTPSVASGISGQGATANDVLTSAATSLEAQSKFQNDMQMMQTKYNMINTASRMKFDAVNNATNMAYDTYIAQLTADKKKNDKSAALIQA